MSEASLKTPEKDLYFVAIKLFLQDRNKLLIATTYSVIETCLEKGLGQTNLISLCNQVLNVRLIKN